MQSVIHEYTNMHSIFDDIEKLFTLTSEIHQQKTLLPSVFDSNFQSIVGVFRSYSDFDGAIDFIDKPYPSMTLERTDDVVVCFSGGKDSIACVLKLLNEYDKEHIHLYHLKSINPSFADECKCAQESAKLLGMDIYVDEIKFKGHHDWMEHPMKNMIIANGAIHYGVRMGYGATIYFGNYTTSFLDDNPFDKCAGDCMDMWDCYKDIFDGVIGGISINSNLENMTETMSILEDKRPLLDVSLSCLCRHSLRPYRHNWVSTKFGIDLFKNRCGSCYKCCIEYVYMLDHDVYQQVGQWREYYKYCLSQLLKVALTENDNSFFIVRDLWEYFFFYEMEESKMFDVLNDSEIVGKHIKWAKGE